MSLDNQLFREKLAKEILERIDNHCIKKYDDGFRSHMGASIIGQECPRAIWYNFRWVYHKIFSGRMYRLFNRGHLEEKRNIEWLRAIGFTIIDEIDGSQQRCVAANGHFGGSCDGNATLPQDLNINEPLLIEFKTKKTGSEFNELKKKGVRFCNWQHYVQMCIYGKMFNLKYAIYFVTNKNDDEMHIEIIPLDWNLAEQKIELADKLVYSKQAPQRIAGSPAFSACKMCDFKPICWDNVPPQKNCRSCWKASPIDNGQWFCEQYNSLIPKTEISKGCDNWEAVK
jgi:hypothetical protein